MAAKKKYMKPQVSDVDSKEPKPSGKTKPFYVELSKMRPTEDQVDLLKRALDADPEQVKLCLALLKASKAQQHRCEETLRAPFSVTLSMAARMRTATQVLRLMEQYGLDLHLSEDPQLSPEVRSIRRTAAEHSEASLRAMSLMMATPQVQFEQKLAIGTRPGPLTEGVDPKTSYALSAALRHDHAPLLKK